MLRLPSLVYYSSMSSEYRGGRPLAKIMREPSSTERAFHWQHGEIPETEVRYTTSRGGGPGGQGVNTTDSRVELRWHIASSQSLSLEQKNRLREHATATARKTIVKDADEIKFVCISERSQHQNKRDCLNRLNAFLRKALTPEEERVATEKSKGTKARERRSSEADRRRKAGRGRAKNWE